MSNKKQKKKNKEIGELHPDDERRLDNEIDRAPYPEIHELDDYTEETDPYSKGFRERLKKRLKK